MEERRGPLANLLSWVLVIAIAVGIGLAVRTFVVEFFEVPSGSMEETIHEGDRLVCLKLGASGGAGLEQGQIVFFDDPSGSGNVLVKRVVATAGQTVDLIDGQVIVDGVPLTEPYTLGNPSEPLGETLDPAGISYPITIGEGQAWVMGDNRTNSRDSRYFGPISASSIIGRAVWTYWPLSSWGALD